MSVYKAGPNSKVVQSPHDSDQNSELYAILMVLLDFKETLNIIADSQYAKRVVLLIETVKPIPNDSELPLLFVQLQQII